MAVVPHVKSGDHKSISSEAAPEMAPVHNGSGRLRRSSRIEQVPGYVGRRAKTEELIIVSTPAVVSPSWPTSSLAVPKGPPVSVAAASFAALPQSEIVIDQDDRTVIPDPSDLPWRHICALRIVSRSNQEYVGTGWFVGPRTVMTAGHCVYLHEDGGWPKAITVIPALNGNVEPFGQLVGTRYRATEAWIARQDTNFDYGAIQLDAVRAGSNAGWFAFGALDDHQLVQNDANVSGYPYDRDRATRQYFHARRVSTVSPQKLFYDIDTFGGQSGSPIWLNLEGDRIAVGVHTTGSSRSNSGTRITAEVFQNMVAWKKEAGAPAQAKDYAAPRMTMSAGEER